MSKKFKITIWNGMDETHVMADSVRIYDEGHQYVELTPRKSDGCITLYAKHQLVIHPQSSNCARVSSRNHER